MKNLQIIFLILFFSNQVFGVSVDIATNADATNFKSSPTSNSSTISTNWIYADLTGTDVRRSVIKFNLSSIPTNAVITSASLKLVQLGGSGSITVNVHRLLRNWTDAQVTWNEYSTGNSWSTVGGGAGTDYTSTATDTKAMSSYSGGTVDSYNVLTDVQNIVNSGGNNYGWIMKLATESGNTYVGYNSQDAGTPANRPILTVVYTVPTPGGIGSSNLIVWYEAKTYTNTTTDGAAVTSWADNNNANALTNTGTVTYNSGSSSTGSINFNPTISNTGSGYLVNNFADTNYSASDIFVVAKNYSVSQNSYSSAPFSTFDLSNPTIANKGNFTFASSAAGSSGNYLSQWFTTDGSGNSAANNSINSGVVKNLLPIIHNANLITNTLSYYLNNITYGSVTNASTGSIYLQNINLFRGLYPGQGTNPWTGYIPEVIKYNTSLSSIERQKVNTYLAVKYGISLGSISSPIDYLNSSGTTVWTGSATYQNDVTGIGRDDASGLNQKQSTTSTGTSVVTMAILSSGSGNSIPSANASNSNTFSADNTYLTWGDDAGNLTGNTSDLPATITKKSARTWKSQLTGTGLAAQNVRVKFDLSNFGIRTVSDYNDYRLILDANGVFAAGATLISPVTGSNASKTVEFDVTMASYSGYYFTIGTTNTSSAPLPLQFASFDVKQIENTTQLIWKTTSEVNCKNFEIEWSRDAINWEKIGTVDALNKASGINNYTFIDNQPHSGLSYYRIKQVDFDGIFTFSTVQSITAHKQINVSIEPNPADDYLEIANQESEEIVYTIFDINSKHIQTGHIDAQSKFKIDTQNLPAGLYIIDFLLQDESFVQKFVVKH